MNAFEIPISSAAPHFLQENEVFGRTIALEFEWIETQGFWLLHVFDNQEKPIVLGIELQPDWPLFTDYHTGFSLALLSRVPKQSLLRTTLMDRFFLVAYESL